MSVPEEAVLYNATLAAVQAAHGKVKAAVLESLVKDGVTDVLEQAQFIEIILILLPILIPLIQKCFDTPERAARAMNNPGPLQRWKLKRKCADEFPDDDDASIAAREHLYNAVLAAGKTMTAEDVKALSA